MYSPCTVKRCLLRLLLYCASVFLLQSERYLDTDAPAPDPLPFRVNNPRLPYHQPHPASGPCYCLVLFVFLSSSRFVLLGTQSTPVKALVSAVGHVLTLVSSLAGSLPGGTGVLERHPVLGSLLRALCIRIPDASVRRSACSVLYRAAHWQALGRDASSSSKGTKVVVGEDLAAVGDVAAKPGKKRAAAANATSTGRSNDLTRVLLARLRADLARVQTVPFARSIGPGAAVKVGLSPVRRTRGGDGSTAAAATADAIGGGIVGGVVPVVVPRLNLVEVTSFVASLVHVMLESPASPFSSFVVADQERQQLSVAASSSEKQAAKQQPPPLPLRPGVLPPTGGADLEGEERSEPVVKNDTGVVASDASADDRLPGVGVGPVNGGRTKRHAEENHPSVVAAEWLLEEAARRLATHEFTETFK